MLQNQVLVVALVDIFALIISHYLRVSTNIPLEPVVVQVSMVAIPH